MDDEQCEAEYIEFVVYANSDGVRMNTDGGRIKTVTQDCNNLNSSQSNDNSRSNINSMRRTPMENPRNYDSSKRNSPLHNKNRSGDSKSPFNSSLKDKSVHSSQKRKKHSPSKIRSLLRSTKTTGRTGLTSEQLEGIADAMKKEGCSRKRGNNPMESETTAKKEGLMESFVIMEGQNIKIIRSYKCSCQSNNLLILMLLGVRKKERIEMKQID